MKAFSLLVLILLAAQVYSQTQPVFYAPFNRTISTTQSGTFLLNQRLPACYQVNYLVTDITSVNEGDMFSVLYVPKTNGSIPAPSSTVTIEFFYGTATAPTTPIKISSVIDQTVNTIPYLSQSNGCAVANNITVNRAAGTPGSGCGINYYCSGFTSTQTTRLWVVITTTDQENAQGIIFDLAVQKASVTITPLTLSQTLTTTTTPPSGSAYFKPTVAQRHYKIKIGAAGTSLTQQADYLTLANPNNILQFTLSNVKVNNVVQTLGTNLGEWSITINANDLAHADNTGLLNTDPDQPCLTDEDQDPAFYTTSTNLTIEYTGCGINAGTYYIAVGLPLSFNTSYTYDLLVSIKPLDNDHYTPTYQTLTQGVYINDNIGYFTTADARLYNIYLLNIANNSFVAGQSSIYVTIFGIDNGELTAEVTQNCFGYSDNFCGACNVLAACDPSDDTDDVNDYCKVKVGPCGTNPNLPYFVTVRSSSTDPSYTYISYSIQFDVVTTNVVDISKLRTEQGNGYVDYIYSGSVAEQAYNHFVYKVNASAVTPLSHLSVNFYVDQAVQQAIVSHNLDKLAGSAPFITKHSEDGISYVQQSGSPFDNCYTWDWFCNTAYKNLGSPIINFNNNDGFNIANYGACSLLLPYCELVEAQVGHYFSVYGVDAGPTSYWSQNSIYNNGIGYNRSIEYTIIFRLWSAAENLDPIEIQNGFIYSNAELLYTYSNQNTLRNFNPDGSDFSDNWYSHQYVFAIPSDGNLYDSIRVVLGDVQTYGSNVNTILYATCGQAAGDCPCFSAADFSCIARDYNTGYNENSCEVYIPLCECNSGKIFLSVRSVSDNYNVVPLTFNLGVYPQITTKVGTVGVPTTAAQIEDLLSPNLDFNPFAFTVTDGPESYGILDSLGTMVFYDTALYALKLSNIGAQRALEFTIRFTRAPSRTAYTQSIIMSIGENVIPPSNPLAADCSIDCVATTKAGSSEAYGFCTIVLDPCQLVVGATYYIRLSAAASISIGGFSDANAGVGYTLTIANVNNAPTALTVGTPYADFVYQGEYAHYSFAAPANQGALHIKVYRNSEQTNPLVVYLNTNGSLAGELPCYEYDERCVLSGDDEHVTCEFFLAACDLTPLAGKTLYLSIQSNQLPSQDYSYLLGPLFQEYYLTQTGYVPGDNAQYFTVDIGFAPLTVLTLAPGSTYTGNLFNFESAYYSYTFAAADITAGKVLHLELQSLEPERYYNDIVQLRTTFSATNPATQTTGCPCSDQYKLNDFKTVLDSCALNGKAGTYYISIKALVNGFDAARDPVSYTLKAYWVTPITQTLALTTTFTAAPKPLNFNDRVVYSIPVTINKNAVIEVEIADLTYQAESLYASGLKAYLNFGTPASESCFDQMCDIYNGLGVQPNGTVMCRLTTTPCTQCSGNYYLTVVADFKAPEPRIQYRSNYTVRAYSRTIGTLDGFTTSGATYRTNATAANGYTFTIANTANPSISCDDRWGSTVFFDYFYQLPALTVNLYETLDVTSSGSNSGSLDIAFGNGVSTSRSGCGCDVLPGNTCNFVSGCQTAATTTVQIYGRVGIASCTASSSNATVNGVAFNTLIKTDRVYTALAPLRATVNQQLNVTNLRAGQYVTIQFQPTNINFNLLPTLTYTLDFVGANANIDTRTCYTTGVGSAVVPTIFPGSVAASSSYCAATSCFQLPSSPLTFDGCCVDPNQNTYVTVYNPLNSGVSAFNFTFLAAVKNLANDYTSLNLPITQTYNVVKNDLTSSFSFTLSPSQVSFDDVVYIRITATNGTVTAYFNARYYSRSAGACTGTDFTCTTGNNCILQLPACFFSTLSPGGYATYYVSLEATSAPIVGPVSVQITPQRTATIPFGSSAVSGSVPDQASTPVDYLNNYKFAYTRSVGDQGLSDNKVALKVVLTPANTANNTLLLSLSSPTASNSNPLAGPPLSGSNPASGGSCDYTNDATWQCFASNNTNGPQTRSTVGNQGVTCFLYYCNNGVSQAELANLLAGQFVYASVQNTESVGRVVTSYTIAVSLQSLTLPNSEVVYTVTPSRANTDANLTSTVCSASFTGGCQYRANNVTTIAYYAVNLANIATWGVNDYLLVNFTQVTATIGINYWYNDVCEPAAGATVLTCNAGENCVVQYDPCDFTWYFRADNGANAYVTEARNIYFRITGLSTASNFSVSFQQVSPLQITVPMTIASPKYTQTFQSWEGRWTMFNFVLPKNQLYDFTVTITSDCGATSAPQVYRNEYVSQWASEHCSEIDSQTLPYSDTHYSCELGGNYFVSVYTPLNSLEFDPISIPEGLVSPQIKFTVTATLNNVAKYTTYAWETELSLAPSNSSNLNYNFLAIGDNENYGTTITISHYTTNNAVGSADLMVVSPLYRETFVQGTDEEAEVVPLGLWNTAFFTAENAAACKFPQCSDVGVYCCSDDNDCVINIPPCDYRNGRYYIYAHNTVASTLTSRIYRQDYIPVTLDASSNYEFFNSGTLPLGLILGDNRNVNYYQFYEINVSNNAYYLDIILYTTYFDILSAEPIANSNIGSNLPLLRGSLKRGDTGVSTSSDNGSSGCQTGDCSACSTVYCSNFVPGACIFGDITCPASTYFLGVWFQYHDDNDNIFDQCDVLDYNILITAQDNAAITILPDTQVCGTVQTSTFTITNPPTEADPFYNSGGSEPLVGSFISDIVGPNSHLSTRNKDGFYDNKEGPWYTSSFPNSVNYKVDLTNVNTATAEFTVDLTVFPTHVGQDIQLSLSTNRPASTVCNACKDSTSISTGDYTASVSITCGAFTELWINVASIYTVTNPSTYPTEAYDYTLIVNTLQYTPVTVSIPSLTFGVPAAVPITLKGNSVVSVSTNNHLIALLAPSGGGLTKVTGASKYTASSCASGCPSVESGCAYLAAQSTYNLFYKASFNSNVECFETAVTQSSASISVQSVHSVTLPSAGFVNVTSSVPFGGADLFYVPLPVFGVTTDSILISTQLELQSGVIVTGSCAGFPSSGCGNTVLFSFNSDTNAATLSVESQLCGCSALYIVVTQDENDCADGTGSATSFTLSFQVNADSLPSAAVALTSSAYVADTLPTLSPANNYNLYTIVAGADGILHSSINQANNTAGTNFHNVEATLYNSQYCVIDTCVTGAFDSQSAPARADNSQDRSCFVYTSNAVSGATYYLTVAPKEAPVDPTATYRLNAITSFTDLETTASSRFQLIGSDRHYYKVAGRAGGVSTGALQSVVVTLNLIDGDRVALVIADSPKYIDNFVAGTAYSGWARSKTCYYADCTLEISTRALHPGNAIFYVWVATVSPDLDSQERIEKFTNYQISATTGTNNCKATTSVSGFCASTVSTLTNVFSYRNITLRNSEAQARFNSFLCRCNPPSSTCIASLTRFSCLESFRECDANGFWTPMCRSECEQTVKSCGAFEESDGSCECTRPEFTCTNTRYSDAATAGCTGATLPSPSPSRQPSGVTPSRNPSGVSSSPLASGASQSRTPSSNGGASASNSPASRRSASRTPTPNNNGGNSGDTIIKYYFIYETSDASSFSMANSFFVLFASALFSLFFF